MGSIMRGLHHDNAVLWLVMLVYWGVGLGSSVTLAFAFGLGGTGIWTGIVLAFVFAVALLAARLVFALTRFGKQHVAGIALPQDALG